MTAFEEIGPLHWEQLVERFDGFHGWVFRGEADANWTLKTSIERETPPNLKAAEAEGILLDEFKRRAHTYLESHLTPADTGEWMALMQHFGAPTRLLDVTASPYVATFFAMEGISPGVARRAVWAINQAWLFQGAGKLKLPTEPKQRKERIDLVARAFNSPPSDLLAEVSMGLELSLQGADDWMRQQDPLVLPFRPAKLSERLAVQQGSFLVPRAVNLPFMVNLVAMGDTSHAVKKILIDSSERVRILPELRLMNISRASLFPGLEGYAQSLKTHLVSEPTESRNIRAALRGLTAEFNSQKA